MTVSMYEKSPIEQSSEFVPPTMWQAEVVLGLRDQEAALEQGALLEQLRASGSGITAPDYTAALESLESLGIVRSSIEGLVLQVSPPSASPR